MSNIVEAPIDIQALSTHQCALFLAMLKTGGPVLELGCGYGSTPILHALCEGQRRALVSMESNAEWYERFAPLQTALHSFMLVTNWDSCDVTLGRSDWSVALVDFAPGWDRPKAISKLASNVEYIVVHDTEPEAEHTYKFDTVRGLFAYKTRFSYSKPNTEVMSNKGFIVECS